MPNQINICSILHIMRKFVSIFIIFALMTSAFDIIDVNDITLNGKEIFTTDNTCADHEEDDLNSNEIHISIVNQIIFALPAPISYIYKIKQGEKHFPNQDTLSLPKFTFSLYRPPIA